MSDDPEDAKSPDQLTPDDDQVRPLDENRYVVSPDDDAASGGGASGPTPTDLGGSRLADATGAFAIDVEARFDGEREELRVETNDVREAFGSILYWYARNAADETPPDEAIDVLIANVDEVR